jgi:hypothetical protein
MVSVFALLLPSAFFTLKVTSCASSEKLTLTALVTASTPSLVAALFYLKNVKIYLLPIKIIIIYVLFLIPLTRNSLTLISDVHDLIIKFRTHGLYWSS